jgi:AcrR family transcriptional regulator
VLASIVSPAPLRRDRAACLFQHRQWHAGRSGHLRTKNRPGITPPDQERYGTTAGPAAAGRLAGAGCRGPAGRSSPLGEAELLPLPGGVPEGGDDDELVAVPLGGLAELDAEVAEQTVYNYFPTKEQLVTDREQQTQDQLCDLIRSRPPAITPAAAIRDFVLESVDAIRGIAPDMWHGELGYLAAISPAVHRLALELTDRQAVALASAISDTTTVAPEIARLQGIALAAVFQIIISEAGQRTREGQSQPEIADELHPIIENVLDELDRWLSA